LDLLIDFYGKIIVPEAVWREIVIEGAGRKEVQGIKNLRDKGFIEIVHLNDTPFLKLLRMDLDEGEAEAIAWAVDNNADLILLDESEARSVATYYNLKKTGVIGILIKAKISGKIPSLKKELDKLREIAGFWISDDLYRMVLEEVDEI